MDLDRIQIFMPKKELLVKLDTNLYMNFSRISQITYYLHDTNIIKLLRTILVFLLKTLSEYSYEFLKSILKTHVKLM